jgi:subtilisin family serine protease
VIAVTATDSGDAIFTMANRGSHIAVAAPGVDILALAPGEALQLTTGTSVATAHVSGLAALLIECKPALKPADIRATLATTAKQLGSGAKLVNAYRAVTSLNAEASETRMAARRRRNSGAATIPAPSNGERFFSARKRLLGVGFVRLIGACRCAQPLRRSLPSCRFSFSRLCRGRRSRASNCFLRRSRAR